MRGVDSEWFFHRNRNAVKKDEQFHLTGDNISASLYGSNGLALSIVDLLRFSRYSLPHLFVAINGQPSRLSCTIKFRLAGVPDVGYTSYRVDPLPASSIYHYEIPSFSSVRFSFHFHGRWLEFRNSYLIHWFEEFRGAANNTTQSHRSPLTTHTHTNTEFYRVE